MWADGIPTNLRLEEDRQCLLVLMGATADGQKELIAMTDGHRESAESWRELLLDVKRSGLGFWQADTREEAAAALNAFAEDYQAKRPKAVECLAKDRDELLTFYTPFQSFGPAEHWRHLRTTNPIESTFATIRLRHKRTKGCGSRTASLTMMFKLAESAAKGWRALNGSELLPAVLQGTPFQDRLLLKEPAA